MAAKKKDETEDKGATLLSIHETPKDVLGNIVDVANDPLAAQKLAEVKAAKEEAEE